MYLTSSALCYEETGGNVYGYPALGDVKNPYYALIDYPAFEDLRKQKSLLNTFPFNQEGNNRFIITWMLHQIFLYSDKVMLAAG